MRTTTNTAQTSNDNLYKSTVDKAKSSYWDTITTLENAIKQSEDSLSGLVFENSDAQKKIDTAWNIQSMSADSLGKARDIIYDSDSFLKNGNYENAYNKMQEADDYIDSINNDLSAIVNEITKAKNFEHDYLERNKFCFLFWCTEVKKLDYVDLRVRDIELEIQKITNKKDALRSNFETFEIKKTANLQLSQKQLELESEQFAKQKKEQELAQKQFELEAEQFAKEQKQREIEEKERQIEAQKQTTLQILARGNPLLKQIMTGEMTFWVQSVPYYAAPGVADSVEDMLDTFESWNGVRRVYNEGSADLKITWIKEFSPHQGGQYWQSYVQVGLGQTGCKGEWQPFVSHSVRQVLWHEIGHAMGHEHSDDQNNIMWGDGLQKYFYKEYEDDIFLEDGYFEWRSFCNGGQYTFSLEGSSESNGFKFWVITPETDAKKFIVENEGLHYPDCKEDGKWISYTMTCSVKNGSKLLIYNPRDNGKSINVDVTTKYTGNMRTYDMSWDRDALKESSQYLYYLDGLR